MAVFLAPPCRSVVIFDEVAAARHRSEFARLLENPGLREHVTTDVVASRAHFAASSGVSSMHVAVEELEGIDRSRSLVARGEILLSAPSAEDVRLLTDGGFECMGRMGSVHRYRNLDADATAVRAMCHELLWRGAKVSPNYVVYAGGFVKARLGLLEPLPTGERSRLSTTNVRWQSAVRLAVLDTSDGRIVGRVAHGSFVAGVVRQVAPGCRLDMRHVLASDGLGTDFSVAQALDQLATDATAVPVVNLSLYCTPVDGLVPVAMAAALDTLAARHPETLVVAAAGNDGSSRPSWPAAHPFVVAVGAVDAAQPVDFSNRGPWVDFSARGDGVVSHHVAWSGTSFAAAQVSGALAAILDRVQSRAEALDELTRSGIPIDGCGVAVEPASIA